MTMSDETSLVWSPRLRMALRIIGAHAPLAGVETLAFTTYQQCRNHIKRHSLRLRTLEQIAG